MDTPTCQKCGLPMSLVDGVHVIAPYWVCDGPNDSTTDQGCYTTTETTDAND